MNQKIKHKSIFFYFFHADLTCIQFELNSIRFARPHQPGAATPKWGPGLPKWHPNWFPGLPESVARGTFKLPQLPFWKKVHKASTPPPLSGAMLLFSGAILTKSWSQMDPKSFQNESGGTILPIWNGKIRTNKNYVFSLLFFMISEVPELWTSLECLHSFCEKFFFYSQKRPGAAQNSSRPRFWSILVRILVDFRWIFKHFFCISSAPNLSFSLGLVRRLP